MIIGANGKILDVISSGTPSQTDASFERAEFFHPQGTALAGNVLYIADTENHLVRAANLLTRQVTTVLGTGEQARRMNAAGSGRQVALNSPWDLLFHEGKLYIAMAGSHQIWVADVKDWSAQPYAGSGEENIKDGKRLEAALAQTSDLTLASNRIYLADNETSSVRDVPIGDAGAMVETVIGKGLFDFGDIDGGSGKARLQHPLGIAANGGLLYVADTYNSKIKVIDPATRSSITYLGGKGLFNEPGGLSVANGKLYVADTNAHRIRVVDMATKGVTTLSLQGVEPPGKEAP